MVESQDTDKQDPSSKNDATDSGIAYSGFDRSLLPDTWKQAVAKFFSPGGGAEKRLGSVSNVKILSKDGETVHKSSFNPKDKNDVISAKVQGARDTKTCHIYEDGKGTTKKGQRRR